MESLPIHIKLYLFLGLLIATLIIFYIIVYRHYTDVHSNDKGQKSWNRHIGTFLIVFTIIISEYQLIFNGKIDIALVSILLGYAIGGKIVNGAVKEK